MTDVNKFVSAALALYTAPNNDATRVVSLEIIRHTVKTPKIEINAIRTLPGFVLGEFYLLDIKYNQLLKYIPTFYNDRGDLARQTFYTLENYAQRINKAAPMADVDKRRALYALKQMAAHGDVMFRHIIAGSDYTYAYTLKNNLVNVQAYAEYNSCIDTMFYRARIQTMRPSEWLPENYNTVNSNDGAFARDIYYILKTNAR